jgi:hypothetical protein
MLIVQIAENAVYRGLFLEFNTGILSDITIIAVRFDLQLTKDDIY